jgi:hypothetical protein
MNAVRDWVRVHAGLETRVTAGLETGATNCWGIFDRRYELLGGCRMGTM